MLKVNTYSLKGTKLTPTTLPKELESELNLNLLAQAIRVYEDRSHKALAQAKTRAEVNRTKKKWYKQKGTGGARHGAKSAPIFVGGGVAHGPRAVKRELTLPKNMARKALSISITEKVKKSQAVAVDGLAKAAKTGELKKLMDKIGGKRFTFILADANFGSGRFIKNLQNCKAVLYKDLNAYKVFFGGTLIFDKEIFASKVKSVRKVAKV